MRRFLALSGAGFVELSEPCSPRPPFTADDADKASVVRAIQLGFENGPFGLPVQVSEKISHLGSATDVALCDLRFYPNGDRRQPRREGARLHARATRLEADAPARQKRRPERW